jgi:ribosome-binding protein aMBF1 (putative translation factor)
MKNDRAGCGRRRRQAKTSHNNRGAYLPGLRSCRTLAALTQRELAGMIGSSPGTISDLENARRKAFPRTVRRLSRALDVEPAELIRKDH